MSILSLTAAGATHIDATKDYPNSISSKVVRCVLDGKRAVAVAGGDKAEVQIKSVLDLLELHLADAPAGARVDSTSVTVVLQQGPHLDEVRDALATLIAAMKGGPEVSPLLLADDGALEPIEQVVPDFGTTDCYERWPGLLKRARAAGAPELLEELWEDLDHGAFRAYPMLSGFPDWSLRLEGLEIGRVREGRGWLDVGKPGAGGRSSATRQLWGGSTGLMDRLVFGPDTIKEASFVIRGFADEWLPRLRPGHDVKVKQNEHALESRILRGACPVSTSSGDKLALLEDHYVISWGSQFPTRWGRVRRGSARYLDGLMKHGNTPWALEMKIAGGTGVGQYYRHAVGQAVLYRHFIRSASPLHFWFEGYAVDPLLCEAAVVVPERTTQLSWRRRLHTMCELFGVDLIEVPPSFAGLSRLEVEQGRFG